MSGQWKKAPVYRKPGSASIVKPWQPPSSFHEVKPGLWLPQGYVPTEWELASPTAVTKEQSAAEFVRCRDSLAYFVFHHIWTLHVDDPTGSPAFRKFPVYPYLVGFFGEVQTLRDYHVEKSRQLMMSWSWMAVFLWDILFHENWGNLAMSRRQDLVDDGGETSSPDSLFGKVRLMWECLPVYLQLPFHFRYMRIACPANDSYMKGEASTASAGRGPAYKRALVDETAHVAKADTIFRGLRHAVKKGLILNSTPLGKGNLFSRIRFNQQSSFRKFRFHWTEHPDLAKGLYCVCGWRSDVGDPLPVNNQYSEHRCLKEFDTDGRPIHPRPLSPWFDRYTSDMTDEQIASELELSCERSARGRVYESWDQSLHTIDHETLVGIMRRNETPLEYRKRYLAAALDPTLITVCGWDFGVNDPASMVLGQVVDEELMTVRWIDEHEENNKSWDYYGDFVASLWEPVVKVVTGQNILHYGDPSGHNRSHDLTSWITNLANPEGHRIDITHMPKKGTMSEWIDFIRTRIRKGDFEVSLWNSHLIDALDQYHYPRDRDGNPLPGQHDPVHDEWSHVMDAMRYVYAFRWHNRLKTVDTIPGELSGMVGAGRGQRTTVPNW